MTRTIYLAKALLLVSCALLSRMTPAVAATAAVTYGPVSHDFRLANIPLETYNGVDANVLVLNDDSGSMLWEVMVEGTDNGAYKFSSAAGQVATHLGGATEKPPRRETGDFPTPGEADAPNEGIWRLRNSTFNTIYYNPDIRYSPWQGLDTADGHSPHRRFADSPPTAAKDRPLSTRTIDLTMAIGFSGSAPVACTIPAPAPAACRVNGSRTTEFKQTIAVSDFYIPRYYTWDDKNMNGKLDATPSPAIDPMGSEGTLVEIKSGKTYPRAAARTDCSTSTASCTYNEELQNFANWFTYHRTRELVAKAALGSVVSKAENLRIGYANINPQHPQPWTDNIFEVAPMNTSDEVGAKAALLKAMYSKNAGGRTPLRQALNEAGKYFSCTNAALECPILPPDGNCQNNFVLMLTDGAWSGPKPDAVIGDADADADAGSPSNFDGGAFAGAFTGTRGPNTDGPTTLADVAMYYYERDLSPLSNLVPTSVRDRALAGDKAFENNDNNLMAQHISTYTIGFGISGNISAEPDDFTEAFDWGDPFSSPESKIDDLRHAAYNGRGEYLDARNGAKLLQRLTDVFAEFSQGSGAVSSVSFNSQEIREDTLIFRASYNAKDNTGDLVAQTFSAQGLVAAPVWSAAQQMDNVEAKDRKIFTWNPHTATGIPFQANKLAASQKQVFMADATTTIAQKVNYLRGAATLEQPGGFRKRPVTKGRLGDIVHSSPIFVGAPDRPGRTVLPWPQGANAYKKFTEANKNRTEIIYVGSNDGMLHGFNAKTGSEVFGYVANHLLSSRFSTTITNLLDPAYQHKYFVDSTPAINDAFIDANANGSKAWTTILVGGHGGGAKAYFALNITDPSKFTESQASDVVMWEFTEADDTYPTNNKGMPLTNAAGTQRQDLQATPQPVKDMGFSFSVPTIAMSNVVDAKGNHEWIALFGNGYNSTAGIAKLFTLFIERGQDGRWCHPDRRFNLGLNGVLPETDACTGKQDFYKVDTGAGAAADGRPNGLGVPRGIDVDYNGTIDYAYAGDIRGNFYRFDLTASDPKQWSATKIFAATYTSNPGNSKPQPITTQPIVTRQALSSGDASGDGGFIVLFATGSYITEEDGSSKDIQSIYGILDRPSSSKAIKKSDLVEQEFQNAQVGGRYVRILSNNAVDYTLAATGGWYIDLDAGFPGERAIRNIQLRGGLVFVNSILPRSTKSCAAAAGGFALSFCAQTGSASCVQDHRGIFDLNNDGNFDALDDVSGDENTPRQLVVGIRFESVIPSDASFIGNLRVTLASDGSLDTIRVDTGSGQPKNTGRLSWRQLDVVD